MSFRLQLFSTSPTATLKPVLPGNWMDEDEPSMAPRFLEALGEDCEPHRSQIVKQSSVKPPQEQ